MALEIERRFIVDASKLPDLWSCKRKSIIQGYFDTVQGSPVVRLRIIDDVIGIFTVKSKIADGINSEYEFEVDINQAKHIISSLKFKIKKTRIEFPLIDSSGNNTGLKWELDIFDNFSQIIAEIELPDIDYNLDVPTWCVAEITNVKGVSNFDMATNPLEVNKKLLLTYTQN